MFCKPFVNQAYYSKLFLGCTLNVCQLQLLSGVWSGIPEKEATLTLACICFYHVMRLHATCILATVTARMTFSNVSVSYSIAVDTFFAKNIYFRD